MQLLDAQTHSGKQVEVSGTTCCRSHLLPTVHDFRDRLPASVSRLQIMPELDPRFALFPAPEYLSPLELPVEVHEPRSCQSLPATSCLAPVSSFTHSSTTSTWKPSTFPLTSWVTPRRRWQPAAW